jgi:hypothetical protein
MRMARVMVVVGLALGAAPRCATAQSDADKRMQRMEQKLERALKEIDSLKAELKQQKAIGQAAQKQSEQTAIVAQDTQAKVAAQKPFELPDWLKRVSLFGDVRVRHEGFYHQPTTKGTTVTARNRERFRARIGLTAKYSDELSATIRAATGNINDPISTNEDFGKVFNRKNFNLDWAYITFSPGKTFNMRPGMLSVTAGKQPVPIFRVGEMVWDDDLSPEGATETLSLIDKPCDMLDQLKVYAFQWQFSEVTNNQDGWIAGGQVNPTMHIGPAQVEAGLGHFWYLNPDQIAQALNTNSSLKNTNLTETALVGSKSTITGFKSGFSLSSESLAVTFPNMVGTMPLKFFEDYVYNWEAASDDAHGIEAGLKLGQTKVRGDWAATAFYEYLGQEAALSTFTYSDFGLGGTNVEGEVVGFDYQLLDPLTLSVKSHFTNFINRPTGTSNPTLTRLQLDAMVKF